MTRWACVLTFAPDADHRVRQAWIDAVNHLGRRDHRVVSSHAGMHHPGSHGPGDATWDLRLESDERPGVAFPDLVTPGRWPVLDAECCALRLRAGNYVPFEGQRVKRALFLAVRSGTEEAAIVGLERSFAAMPKFIPAIRGWAISRVDTERSTSTWTHVFEQEFETLDGLLLDYRRHPYHWTGIGRWMDPEVPGSIVDRRLGHLLRLAAEPVLGPDVNAELEPTMSAVVEGD